MSTTPPLAPIVAALPATTPFVGPEAQERARGRPFAARLGANESGFGPGPAARAALAEHAGEAWMYGDPECYDLRNALSQRLGAPTASIVVGEGIDGLLGVCCRLWLAPGDVAVTSLGAYPTFNYHVASCGGRLETVPYVGDYEDFDALAARAASTGARLLYVSNPDNPMGSWRDAEAVERLIAAAPAECMLLLDEAYVECAPEDAAPPIDPSRPNVLRLRTFSKLYGLAGLRIGYAIGAPQAIAAFEKIRNHFGVGRLSQIAALAALQDAAQADLARRAVAEARDRISALAVANGLAPLPSATNFVAIDCGGRAAAERAMARLLEQDVFVRKPAAPGLDRVVRISCGPTDALDAFAAALPSAADAARAAAAEAEES